MNNSIAFLNKTTEVKIDRTMGSKHPKHGFIYPVNYGYVPGTISDDGEELDAYVLGIYEPVETFTGKCIAIIHRTNDNDDKLIVVPEGNSFSDSQIRALTDFQERFFESEIIRSSEDLEFNKTIPELSVTNLENSLNFYKALGFRIEYERPENKFSFLSLGAIQFMLQELDDNNKWDVAPLTYPFGNGINFQLEVENVDKIYNSLKENNYKIAFEIEENWYRQDNKLLGNKEFLVQDPDGYLLRFSEDLGEKEIEPTKDFEVRLATYSDCHKLSLLKKEIWETTYRGIYPNEKIDNYDYSRNEEKFKKIIDNADIQLYVVTKNDEIIAYIDFGKPFRPFADYTQEIGLFYIKKDYQRLGLGRKLFNFAFDYIKNTGTDKFFISCHKYNTNAQKFYEKMGGKVVDIDDDSANDGVPQIKYEYVIN